MFFSHRNRRISIQLRWHFQPSSNISDEMVTSIIAAWVVAQGAKSMCTASCRKLSILSHLPMQHCGSTTVATCESVVSYTYLVYIWLLALMGFVRLALSLFLFYMNERCTSVPRIVDVFWKEILGFLRSQLGKHDPILLCTRQHDESILRNILQKNTNPLSML